MAEKKVKEEPRKTQESPQMPDPAQAPDAAQSGGDFTETLQLLEEIGKTSPDEIRGMHEASQQYGHVQNLLGEARREIAQLRTVLEQRHQQPPSQDIWNASEDRPLTRKEVKDVLREFATEVGTEQQQRAEWYNREVGKARKSKYYKVVGKDFEAMLQDQDTQNRIWSGESTPSEILAEAALDKLSRLATDMGSRFQSLPNKAGSQTAPHIEAGGQQIIAPSEADELKSDLEELRKLRQEGRIDGDEYLERKAKLIGLGIPESMWFARQRRE